MTNYTKKAVKGVLWVFIALFLSNVFAYLLRLVLARNLVPKEYGLIYAIFSLVGLFSVFQHMGLQEALVKYIAYYSVKKDFKAIKASIYITLIIQLIAAVFFGVAGIIFAEWLAESYFQMEIAAPLIKLYMISIMLSPFEIIFLSIFQGFQKMSLHSLVLFTRMIFLFTITYLMLSAGYGVFAPITAYVLVYLLSFVLYAPIFLKKVFPNFFNIPAVINKVFVYRLLKYSFPVMLTAAAGIVLTYTDTVMLTYFKGLEEVALYNAALPTARVMWVLIQSITLVLFPLSAELWEKNRFYLKEAVINLYKFSIILILPVCLTVLAFPKLVLNIFFGSQYVSAYPVLQILSIGALFFTIGSINGIVISGIGKPAWNSRIVWFASIFNFLSNILLIQWIGIIGAAISTLIAFIIIMVTSTVFLNRLELSEVPVRHWAITLAAGFVFLGTVTFLKSFLKLNVWLELVITVTTALIFYSVIIFFSKTITVNEVKKLLSRIRS